MESKPDPLDRLRFDHEAFLASRTGVYVGRDSYFERLDAAADLSGGGVGVFGGSGLGKSALLANWVERRRRSHPSEVIIPHFVGATAQSAGWDQMLRRVMGELDRRFDLGLEIPDDAQELRVAFAGSLHRAATQGRVVLVFDGVNGLEDREGALDLMWMPPEIPAGVTVVVSTLPGRSRDMLEEWDWPTLEVEPLTVDERQALIGTYLAQYTKRLSDVRVDRIADAAQSSNPLYLRVLLEELRLFGVHEQLDERIDHYLQAVNPVDLYGLVLERFEEDYETRRPGLVGDSFSLLWTARRGLSETELLDLLGDGAEPLPQAVWSPLHLAARSSLVDRGGLLGFAHDYLRAAIHDRYLTTDEQEAMVRRRLVDYFDRRRLSDRAADELPHQLTQLRDWDRLVELLKDLESLQTVARLGEEELKMVWARIEAESAHSVSDTYRPLVDNADQTSSEGLWIVGTLLYSFGDLDGAMTVSSYLAGHFQATGELDRPQRSMGNQGVIHQRRGDLDNAMKLYQEQERICRRLGYIESLQRSLGNQGGIHETWGDLDTAMELYREKERICRQLGNLGSLQVSLGYQGVIHQRRGDLDTAMELYREQERICRQLGNLDSLQASLGKQGSVHERWGDLEPPWSSTASRSGSAANSATSAVSKSHWGTKEVSTRGGGIWTPPWSSTASRSGSAANSMPPAVSISHWGTKEVSTRGGGIWTTPWSSTASRSGSAANSATSTVSKPHWGTKEASTRRGGIWTPPWSSTASRSGSAANSTTPTASKSHWGTKVSSISGGGIWTPPWSSTGRRSGSAANSATSTVSKPHWGTKVSSTSGGGIWTPPWSSTASRSGSAANSMPPAVSRSHWGTRCHPETWGDLDTAMELYREQERICRRTRQPRQSPSLTGVPRCHPSAAGGSGHRHGALPRAGADLPPTGTSAVSASHWGTKEASTRRGGDLDTAMELYREKERICRRLDAPGSLHISLGEPRKVSTKRWGDLDTAMELYRERGADLPPTRCPRQSPRSHWRTKQASTTCAGIWTPPWSSTASRSGSAANSTTLAASVSHSRTRRLSPTSKANPPMPGVSSRRSPRHCPHPSPHRSSVNQLTPIHRHILQ